MEPEDLKKIMKRRDESKRRAYLMKIIELIEQGELNSGKVPSDELYYGKGQPRSRYVAPEDRGSYNHGYMEIDEMMTESPSVR